MGHHNIRYTGDPHAATGVWGYPDSVAKYVLSGAFALVPRLIISYVHC